MCDIWAFHTDMDEEPLFRNMTPSKLAYRCQHLRGVCRSSGYSKKSYYMIWWHHISEKWNIQILYSVSLDAHLQLPWLSFLCSQIGMTGRKSCGTVGEASPWRWRHCLKKECARSWLADGRTVGSLWRHSSVNWWKGCENLRCCRVFKCIMLLATLSPTPESAWCTAINKVS